MSTAIIVAQPDTPEWHAARTSGIGASESSAACGVSEYETPLGLYHRKRGEILDAFENDAMRLGKALEPVILSEFTHRTGIGIRQYPCPMLRHSEWSWMLATPDADCEDGAYAEAKSTSWRMASRLGESDSDDIPNEWVMQAQQQMAVGGRECVHVPVLLDGRTFHKFTVHRDDSLIEHIVAMERELWERIQNGDPPEANWEHSRTVAIIRELYGTVENDRIVELSAHVARLWIDAKMLKSEARKMQQDARRIEAQVLQEIGHNYAGILPGGETMVRRKRIERAAYTVDAASYVDVREVKIPKELKART